MNTLSSAGAGVRPARGRGLRAVGLAAMVTAGSMVMLTLSASGAAAWGRHGHYYYPPPPAGVIGGMAVGALAGAALAGRLAPPPYYAAPPVVVYRSYPVCYLTRRHVWIKGVGWRRRTVEVCG
ncbi:hypothetical protein ACFFJB_08670 [Camelimonas abortus]|uniref:Uncharacterized protein n=1 Tax=Camelimonas abortus TaxID=1017184 RepID=A0ABV7LGS1_9HYPH